MEPILEVRLDAGREHIELCDLLKHVGLTDSGGAAKRVIADGAVTVDGATETRKRRKVRPGQVVRFAGRQVQVRGPDAAGPAAANGEPAASSGSVPLAPNDA